MEMEGLKRGLEYLTKTVKIDVKDLITDRHVMIKKYMKEKQKDINHFFDVWHIAKGNHDLYKLFRSIFLQFFNFHHHIMEKKKSKYLAFLKKKIALHNYALKVYQF